MIKNITTKGMAKSVLFTWLVCLIGFQASAQNLALNPGFESGINTNWITTTSGSAQISAATSQTYTGSYCALFRRNGSAELSQTISVTSNTTYIFNSWIRISNNATLVMGAKDFGGTTVTTSETNNGGVYTLHTIQFTTGSSATSATVYFSKNNGGQQE